MPDSPEQIARIIARKNPPKTASDIRRVQRKAEEEFARIERRASRILGLLKRLNYPTRGLDHACYATMRKGPAWLLREGEEMFKNVTQVPTGYNCNWYIMPNATLFYHESNIDSGVGWSKSSSLRDYFRESLSNGSSETLGYIIWLRRYMDRFIGELERKIRHNWKEPR